MAITGLTRTYDQSEVIREDLEDIISMISPTETPLFALLNRVPVFNTKHEWVEDTLRGMTSNLAVEMDAQRTANVSLYVQDGHGPLRFPVAATKPLLLRVDQELMLATARTTDTLTVTRDYNSKNATAAHVSNSIVEVIADLGIEGADARAAHSQTRTKPYNICQVFDATVQITGTMEQVIKAGIAGSESDYQIEQRLKEMKILLERSMLMGTRVDGSSSTFRAMRGMAEWIASNNSNASGVAVTAANIEADARACYDSGGNPGLIICNSYLAERITKLYETRIRTEPEEILGGAQIHRILLPIAGMAELAIIVDRWIPSNEYLILDPTKVALGRLRGFEMDELAKTGDAEKSQVLGEYTLVFKNENAHARRYNLATS